VVPPRSPHEARRYACPTPGAPTLYPSVTEKEAFAARLGHEVGLTVPQLTGERNSQVRAIAVIVPVLQLVTVKVWEYGPLRLGWATPVGVVVTLRPLHPVGGGGPWASTDEGTMTPSRGKSRSQSDEKRRHIGESGESRPLL
jgi:hypothetical protein